MTLTSPADVDVAVVGLGPAGRSLAGRCAAAGLTVTAVDLRPGRVWTPTYALWADELPWWLDDSVVAARVQAPQVWARTEHAVPRPYAVLDTAELQRSLALDGVRVIAGRATVVDRTRITLADGAVVRARHVVDARGLPPAPAVAQQTAYGVVVPRERALPALGPGGAWFMDWRPDNGAPAGEPPSFLYAIPLDADRVLLEETCLAARPALGPDQLRERLHARAASRGVELRPGDATETVRIALQGSGIPRLTRRRGAVRFGAGGALVHPCTGYSLGATLGLADPLARALAESRDPTALLWPRRAVAVEVLRRRGLAALVALGPEPTVEFFESFFTLPAPRQRAFLSLRDRPTAVAAAMWALFRAVPGPVRRSLAGAVLP
ncbi:lycopene cyclase family protein [Speluncibacter jeojiensis]|uniref:Lycopene cyclase family protein n=1 Tax=Speluncibacter jeojiensis TaxID=2710754 RepID=A0A9X4M4I8_9ACTN|nr:lycopene cyclase family protein [Corynebacteriales bacterium D3-21]